MAKSLILALLLACSSLLHAEPAKRIDASSFPSLQAALDALPETGGFVTVPPGDYELTHPLIVRTAETRIVGSGAATHFINKNEEGQPALMMAPAAIATDKKARLWRVQVADLRISGNPKSGDGIFAHGIHEIYLHGVSIDHHGGNGIHLLNCEEEPRASAIASSPTMRWLACKSTAATTSWSTATTSKRTRTASAASTASISARTATTSTTTCGMASSIENTYGSVCSGNMIEECNGTAIILGP